MALAGLRVAQGEACAVSRDLNGTALAGDPVVLADDAERVGAVGEIGRQLVQQRTGAEDLGCEIDGEVLGDGRCCGCGDRYCNGDRSRCRCGNLVTGRCGCGLDGRLRRCFRLNCEIRRFHGDGRVCGLGFGIGSRGILCLDRWLCLGWRGYHGGDAGVCVLGVIDDRERDGRLRRLGLRCRLGSVLIVGLVGLIVLGLVAKDIAVLERRRLGLVGGFFGCRLGSLVELRSGFLL